jgi:hypothetical protein
MIYIHKKLGNIRLYHIRKLRDLDKKSRQKLYKMVSVNNYNKYSLVADEQCICGIKLTNLHTYIVSFNIGLTRLSGVCFTHKNFGHIDLEENIYTYNLNYKVLCNMSRHKIRSSINIREITVYPGISGTELSYSTQKKMRDNDFVSRINFIVNGL